MGSEGWLRPEYEVLNEGSVIPPENQIQPPPNQFTHRVLNDEPFFLRSQAVSDVPDGELVAGTKVVLLRRDGAARCRVADGRGLHVEIGFGSLADLHGS